MAKPAKSDTELEATAEHVAQAAAGKGASQPEKTPDEGFLAPDEAPTEIVTPAGSLLIDPTASELPDSSEAEGASDSSASSSTDRAKDAASAAAAASTAGLKKGAEQAKTHGTKAGNRIKSAASDAGKRASTAASDARDRAAAADVGQFAASTTSLIDSARPFFLAGFAVAFAILGWIENDSDTAQLFVFGSILFVLGAAFSGEINSFVAHKFHRRASDDDRS